MHMSRHGAAHPVRMIQFNARRIRNPEKTHFFVRHFVLPPAARKYYKALIIEDRIQMKTRID